ncbi:hypothetical protein [Streptomyces sp. NPDC126514]|uniref:hypothetical protein n=1 Tax=Streptomyces sp. NPDC126514 TaxID=3155210 RepID=UPI00331FAAF4
MATLTPTRRRTAAYATTLAALTAGLFLTGVGSAQADEGDQASLTSGPDIEGMYPYLSNGYLSHQDMVDAATSAFSQTGIAASEFSRS